MLTKIKESFQIINKYNPLRIIKNSFLRGTKGEENIIIVLFTWGLIGIVWVNNTWNFIGKFNYKMSTESIFYPSHYNLLCSLIYIYTTFYVVEMYC